MRYPPKFVFVCLLTCSALLGVPSSSAYELTGFSLGSTYRWKFNFDSCREETFDETVRAFDMFDHFNPTNYLGGTRASPGLDRSSVIYCGQIFDDAIQDLPPGIGYDSEDLTLGSGSANFTIGRAHWWYDLGTGRIVECDIQIVDFIGGWETALKHEIGHCYGLAHSRDPGALLYQYAGAGESLHVDDLAGLCAMYECEEAIVDYEGSLFIPKVRRFDSEDCYQGRVKFGTLWPAGVRDSDVERLEACQ